MHLVLEEADHNAQHVECHRCHWQGSSSELHRGEYFPLGDFTEIFCPRCNKYLGFIQHAPGAGETQ